MKVAAQKVYNHLNAIAAYKTLVASEKKPKGKLYERLISNEKVLSDTSAKIQRSLENLRIDHCSVDEKGNIIRDAKNQYAFTKDGQRALNKAFEEYLEKTIDIPLLEKIKPSGDMPMDEEELDAFQLIIDGKNNV